MRGRGLPHLGARRGVPTDMAKPSKAQPSAIMYIFVKTGRHADDVGEGGEIEELDRRQLRHRRPICAKQYDQEPSVAQKRGHLACVCG